jgi:hypothetical protein
MFLAGLLSIGYCEKDRVDRTAVCYLGGRIIRGEGWREMFAVPPPTLYLLVLTFLAGQLHWADRGIHLIAPEFNSTGPAFG